MVTGEPPKLALIEKVRFLPGLLKTQHDWVLRDLLQVSNQPSKLARRVRVPYPAPVRAAVNG